VFAIKFKEHGAYKTERKRIFRSPKDYGTRLTGYAGMQWGVL
jgi:hypothetical protein